PQLQVAFFSTSRNARPTKLVGVERINLGWSFRYLAIFGKEFREAGAEFFGLLWQVGKIRVVRSLARIPTHGKVFLSEVRRQTSFDLGKVSRAGGPGLGIGLPIVWVVEGEIQKMFR